MLRLYIYFSETISECPTNMIVHSRINFRISNSSDSSFIIITGLFAYAAFFLLQIVFFCFVITLSGAEPEKAPVTVTRTELKVSRSLNPEDTQMLNVMTRDGSVAQLIVKKRDPKAKQSNQQNLQSVDSNPQASYSRSIYTNWLPVSTLYAHPNIIRLDTFTLTKNSTEEKKTAGINNNLGNVIDSDR